MENKSIPSYHFSVQWGGTNIGFMEVSGLNIWVDVEESRNGAALGNSANKMPGQLHYSNIVLKRPIKPGDNEFFNWMKTIELNTVERRDIRISLLDKNHEPVIIWKVRNAFPVRLSGPVLNANNSGVAMEEMEIAHESLAVEVPNA